MYRYFPWLKNREYLIIHAFLDFLITFLISNASLSDPYSSTFFGFTWILVSYIIGKYSISNNSKLIRSFNYLFKIFGICLIFFFTSSILIYIWGIDSNIYKIILKIITIQTILFIFTNNLIIQKNLRKYFLFIGSDKNFATCQTLIKQTSSNIELKKFTLVEDCLKEKIKGVIIEKPLPKKNQDLILFIKTLKEEGFLIYSLLDWASLELNNCPVEFFNDNDNFINQFSILNKPFQYRIKKVSELFLSLFLLISTSPLILIAMLLIYLEDKGNIFYTQQRDGIYGKQFNLIKLRTMKKDAENKGAQWSIKNDKRITKIGSLLRKTRIDELPQLISVLKGEMNLIGPRPERRFFNQSLEKAIPFYNLRHEVRPGISGWAQVNYSYGSSTEDSKMKLSYDLYYIKNFSNLLDLLILFKTIRLVLNARGAITKNG